MNLADEMRELTKVGEVRVKEISERRVDAVWDAVVKTIKCEANAGKHTANVDYRRLRDFEFMDQYTLIDRLKANGFEAREDMGTVFIFWD